MFVVFEGIDGSGKTTISGMVAERLRARSLSVKHLRAEGRFVSTVSEAIRELGRDARNLELVPKAEFLLYVARDVQLIEEVLRPALPEHDVVLADRFLYTAETLGHYGQGLSPEYIEPILKAAAGGIAPDLVILVDVDPALARARRKAYKIAKANARPPSRKNLAGVGLQHRLRRGYLELSRRDPERWVVVDNQAQLEVTVERVVGLIEAAHRSTPSSALARFRAASAIPTRQSALKPLRSPEDALEAFLDWLDRRAEREPGVAAYMLSGLWGLPVDERRCLLARSVPEATLAALTGLDDEVSWQLRDELRSSYPRHVAKSLLGLRDGNERATALRLLLECQAPHEVALSLSGLDDASAWGLRERLYQEHPDAVIGSLKSLNSARAWQLREDWLGSACAELRSNYELARTAAKSISGLDDDRAWSIREAARAAAPVAVLASLSRLVDLASWQYRERALARAPKVVMATLRGIGHARAWEMRRAIADRCKEALDSIISLEEPAAWELREAYADVWPSTVVKTLGTLSDMPRGRALIERQLAAHPGNVSMLKHAAAVALGAHRIEFSEMIEA